MKALTEAVRTPVAAGDEVSVPSVIETLITDRAVDVVRLDATSMGGFAGFGRLAAQAHAAGFQSSHHAYGEIQQHCVFAWPAVTPVAHDMHWLSHLVHGIMIVIVLFVVTLIAIVVLRFNSRRNPTPSSFTHNTRIEIAWTLIPVVILIMIGSFSLPILFKQLDVPTPDLTVKATGNQWYWTYDYPANAVTFDSLMLAPADLAAYGYGPESNLLAADNARMCEIVIAADKLARRLERLLDDGGLGVRTDEIIDALDAFKVVRNGH